MTRSWADVVEAAPSLDTNERLQSLAQVCAAYSELVRPYLYGQRPGGGPPGRPTPVLARRAAKMICNDHSSDWRATDLAVLEAIALIHLWAAPGSTPSTQHEFDPALQALAEARAIAERAGRRDVVVWAMWVEAVTYFRAAHASLSIPGLRQAIHLLEEPAASVTTAAQEARTLTAILGSPAWFPPTDELAAVQRFRLARRLNLSASAAGDRKAWDEGYALTLSSGEQAARYRPHIGPEALKARAARARITGDRAGQAAAEAELAALAEESTGLDLLEVQRWLTGVQTGNAEAMKDWQRVYDLNDERLSWSLANVRAELETAGHVLGEHDSEVIDTLLGLGDRTWTAGIGNAALGRATASYRTGRSQQSEEAWVQAMADLDFAESAYAGYGSNGFVATALTRARLLHYAPGGPRVSVDDTVTSLLEVTRDSKQGTMRRNAIINAVEVSAPGDPRVAQRLQELIAIDQDVHGPRLRGAMVMFERKAAAVAPAELQALALAAAEDLEPAGRLLDAVLAAECWLAAADAAEKLDLARVVVLERLLQAVRCLSAQLISITSPTERRDLGVRYAEEIRRAANLAIDLGDARAAELIMEAMRRDQVGSLLIRLVDDPGVASEVRAAAEAVQLANSVVPTVPGDVPKGEVRRWLQHSADTITAAQEQAARAATAVLGPLAALADISTLGSATALQLMAEQDGPQAVLQLLATNAGFLDDGSSGEVVWLLSLLRSDGTIDELCGSETLHIDPEHLQPPQVFWHAYYLSRTLIPAPLREYLLIEGADEPVRLTVIPTGLLGVPFDALVLDEGRGVQVVDRAALTVVGSVTTARALASTSSRHPDAGGAVAVFDTSRLAHAGSELAALKKVRPSVVEVGSISALLDLLVGKVDILAMAVHGSDDTTSGWGQTKLLPDGSTISALDLLHRSDVRVPRQCVIASCHSGLVAEAGVQLGGFPIALILRGAEVIVGSTYEVPDAETAAMMVHYWSHVGQGARPDVALQRAKVALLEDHPRLRSETGRWAAVFVYGHP